MTKGRPCNYRQWPPPKSELDLGTVSKILACCFRSLIMSQPLFPTLKVQTRYPSHFSKLQHPTLFLHYSLSWHNKTRRTHLSHVPTRHAPTCPWCRRWTGHTGPGRPGRSWCSHCGTVSAEWRCPPQAAERPGDQPPSCTSCCLKGWCQGIKYLSATFLHIMLTERLMSSH